MRQTLIGFIDEENFQSFAAGIKRKFTLEKGF
jgi:hypothetical protein